MESENRVADAVMDAAARGTGIGWAVQGRVRNGAQQNGRDDELRGWRGRRILVVVGCLAVGLVVCAAWCVRSAPK